MRIQLGRTALLLAMCIAATTAHAQAPDTSAAPTKGSVAAPRPRPDGSLGPPLIVPELYYTPETRLGIGVGVLASTIERNPRQRPALYSANTSATQNGQFSLTGAADIWTRNNALRVETDFSAQRFPNRFFGLGNNTPNTTEKYTPTTIAGAFGIQKALRPGVYLGGRLTMDRTALSNLSPTGTIQLLPERDGWRLITVGTSLVVDSRNRLFAPTSGMVASLAYTRSDRGLGSELAFNRVLLDVRGYTAIHPQGVLAFQLRNDALMGDAPFERLPSLGGSALLRGYFSGRYRDKTSTLAQGEYRLGPYWDQLVGFTLFGGAGAVSPTIHDVSDARFHVAGGGGVRLVLNPASGLALRLDYGVARGSRGFYISVGEAF